MNNSSCFVSPEKDATACRVAVEAEEGDTQQLLEKELMENLDLNREQAKAAAHGLLSLGCHSLAEIAFFEATDFRFQIISLPATLLPLTRSKLLLAHEILRREDSGLAELKRCMLPRNKNKESNPVIRLQVGEHRFTTNRRTLCRVEGSFLECLVSGRHSHYSQRMPDGAYFIDRCGKHFSYILDYLRCGTVLSLPDQDNDKKALELEADYYGLEELVQVIRMPNISIDAFLSEKTQRIQKNEQEIRSAYYQGDGSSIQKHQGLIRLFAEGPWKTPIQHDPDSLTDKLEILMMPKKKMPTAGAEVTVSDLEEFRTQFNRSHPNVLHRLEPVPIVIAGGSVLAALQARGGVSSDVDLFVCTTNPEEATRIAHRVWVALAHDQERWVVIRSVGVINMHLFVHDFEPATQKVQIVLRLYESPAEVIYGFDCDCCACAYDGRDVLLTPRCYRSLETTTIIVNPIHAWPNSPSYELRLAKYASKGFRIGVPGLDVKRVDVRKLIATPIRELKGLGRLVYIALEWIRSHHLGTFTSSPISELLRGVVIDTLDPTKQLLIGSTAQGFYDDSPSRVLVPFVYCDGNPWVVNWISGDIEDVFPIAQLSREPAWQQIEHWDEDDPEGSSEGIYHELVRSWSTWERSREYLNNLMEKDDVDNIYYLGAYNMNCGTED